MADHFNVPNFDPENPEAYTAQMKRELGKGPLPIEPILAAKGGNGFVLGLRPFEPKRAADVKIQLALEAYKLVPKKDDGAEFADVSEFVEEVAETTPEELETWPAFLAARRKEGKTAAEAGQLWKERQALQEA